MFGSTAIIKILMQIIIIERNSKPHLLGGQSANPVYTGSVKVGWPSYDVIGPVRRSKKMATV